MKALSIKRILPAVVVASAMSFALLAGCTETERNDMSEGGVVDEEAVVVEPDATMDEGISKDEAKAIALEYENLLEPDVKNMQITENVMDGIKVYEVVFDADNVKYEFVIDATTGDILEYMGETVSSSGADASSNDSGSSAGSGSSANGSSSAAK